jgi:NAD kinase
MHELDAVELIRNTFGFLTNLHPDEIKECFQDVILSDCERCWIVNATSPFDGKGDDLAHTWLWAMPDYQP